MSCQNKILCCLCGSSIDPNEAAMCEKCIQSQCDITEGIEKNGEVIQCKKCDRWMVRQDCWVHHDWESNGLLAFCLKKINGIQKNGVKVIDAFFVWTEPHSKRIKVSIDIERPVLEDKIKIRQKNITEFVIKNKQCHDCIREATDHNWGALVQIRQYVGHKRTFFHLENLLTEAGMHNLIMDIELPKDGLDLYFKSKNQSDKVVDFLISNLPVRVKHSKKLVSRDLHSNVSNYEYTVIIEIVPICKEDLILLPKEYTGAVELMIVTKVSSSLHLINPKTMNKIEITAVKYYSNPFKPIFNSVQLVPFVILDIKSKESHQQNLSIKETGGLFSEMEVAKESDLGENDTTYQVYTHLGHIFQPGDLALGYDLIHAVLNAEDEKLLNKLLYSPPDVILTRKTYPERAKAKKKKTPSWMIAEKKSGRKGKQDKSSDDREIELFETQQSDFILLAEEEDNAVL